MKAGAHEYAQGGGEHYFRRAYDMCCRHGVKKPPIHQTNQASLSPSIGLHECIHIHVYKHLYIYSKSMHTQIYIYRSSVVAPWYYQFITAVTDNISTLLWKQTRGSGRCRPFVTGAHWYPARHGRVREGAGVAVNRKPCKSQTPHAIYG